MRNTDQNLKKAPSYPLGVHIRRRVVDQYDLAQALQGGPEASAVSRARTVANLVNGDNSGSERPISTGELLTAGALMDALRHIASVYCEDDYPGILDHAAGYALEHLGPVSVRRAMGEFVRQFPPREICVGEITQESFLGAGEDRSGFVCLESIFLRLANENRAMVPLLDLFDDHDLRRQAPYERVVASLEDFFQKQPPFRNTQESLVAFLAAPMRACPDSLEGQLEYVRQYWAVFLPEEILSRVLIAQGVVQEEHFFRGHGPGPSQVLEFGHGAAAAAFGGPGTSDVADTWYPEPEAFTVDRAWMPNAVLIAKSTYVWLDQLTKKYERPINRLDEIPDEELDLLGRWGFTSLWLIGLWERSSASQRIKRLTGNPEALASAYSLYDYEIAHDLGGEAAFHSLADRAWRRGIRLASDMVPNHVGLYSKWVIEHPDWFIQSENPPYPGYLFTGPNLSEDPRVILQIEDGYWNHSDASVVFKRTDPVSGEVRYIYHGNDGTNMPWNDTAQLDFCQADVREAVIQTILHVARMFPVIRFDAAMTLAKRHFQRLWFPQSGEAGAIPSRAEYGMSRADFDAVIPQEFWREVVDRVNEEAPDTLLLAEAFWLMEGYFVRTLGMHRVYNSAFMNMLKLEENSKYRQTLKNVLEFSPDVLPRFVNFMNNPDERTAVEQFGDGDKYFGVAMMMVTMPGLPMFGHGQIEGYTEKYGMEYRRAYWDEKVNWGLVKRHETEIFPLMRRRHLFSGSQYFALFDFVTPEGWVDENVYAYCNRADTERALVLYNNAYNATRGCLFYSTAINIGDADNKELVRKTLGDALSLSAGEDVYYVFRDVRTNLEYLRNGRRLVQEGLHIELQAYEFYVFLDWREMRDRDGIWKRLALRLGDAGVPDMDEALQEMLLEPVLEPLRKVMNGSMLASLCKKESRVTMAGFTKAAGVFFTKASAVFAPAATPKALQAEVVAAVKLVRMLEKALKPVGLPEKVIETLFETGEMNLPAALRIPVAWAIMYMVARGRVEDVALGIGAEGLPQEKALTRVVEEAFIAQAALADPKGDAEVCKWFADQDARLVELMVRHVHFLDFTPGAGDATLTRRVFETRSMREFLGMNWHDGIWWFNREQLERLTYWWFVAALLVLAMDDKLTEEAVLARWDNVLRLRNTASRAGYKVEDFLALLSVEAC